MRKIIMIAAAVGFAASAFAKSGDPDPSVVAPARPVKARGVRAPLPPPIPLVEIPTGAVLGSALDTGIVIVDRISLTPANPLVNQPCEIEVFLQLANGESVQMRGIANLGRGVLEPMNLPYQNGRVEAGRFALIGQHAVLLELRGLGAAAMGLFIQKTVAGVNPNTGALTGFGLQQAPGTKWYVTNGNALVSYDPIISTYEYDDVTITNSFILQGVSGFNAANFLGQFVNNPGTTPDSFKKACVNCNEVSVPVPAPARPGYPPYVSPRGGYGDPYHDGSIRRPY